MSFLLSEEYRRLLMADFTMNVVEAFGYWLCFQTGKPLHEVRLIEGKHDQPKTTTLRVFSDISYFDTSSFFFGFQSDSDAAKQKIASGFVLPNPPDSPPKKRSYLGINEGIHNLYLRCYI